MLSAIDPTYEVLNLSDEALGQELLVWWINLAADSNDLDQLDTNNQIPKSCKP